MAIGQNRAELLMVEMQEERARALVVVLLGACVAAFGMLAALTLTALIVCAFASHLLLVLGVLTVVYGIGAALFCVKLSQILSHWDGFTATREQFERDREFLEKKAA